MHLTLSAVALGLLGAAAVRAEFPDVSKLPSRPDLPDPLVMFNGDRVTTKEQWVDKRRPELKALFQYYMYGDLPPRRTRSMRRSSAWTPRRSTARRR